MNSQDSSFDIELITKFHRLSLLLLPHCIPLRWSISGGHWRTSTQATCTVWATSFRWPPAEDRAPSTVCRNLYRPSSNRRTSPNRIINNSNKPPTRTKGWRVSSLLFLWPTVLQHWPPATNGGGRCRALVKVLLHHREYLKKDFKLSLLDWGRDRRYSSQQQQQQQQPHYPLKVERILRRRPPPPSTGSLFATIRHHSPSSPAIFCLTLTLLSYTINNIYKWEMIEEGIWARGGKGLVEWEEEVEQDNCIESNNS